MNNTADRQDLLRSKKARKAHQMIQGPYFFFRGPIMTCSCGSFAEK